MKAVILCGGEGTRMRPLSYSRPKHLISVANRPVLDWIIDDLSRAGVDRIAVIASPSTERRCRAFCAERTCDGRELTIIVQEEAKGIAHAVLCAEEFVAGDSFLLYLGDNLFEHGVEKLVELFLAEHPSAAIALKKVDDPRRFGVARLEDGSSSWWRSLRFRPARLLLLARTSSQRPYSMRRCGSSHPSKGNSRSLTRSNG